MWRHFRWSVPVAVWLRIVEIRTPSVNPVCTWSFHSSHSELRRHLETSSRTACAVSVCGQNPFGLRLDRAKIRREMGRGKVPSAALARTRDEFCHKEWKYIGLFLISFLGTFPYNSPLELNPTLTQTQTQTWIWPKVTARAFSSPGITISTCIRRRQKLFTIVSQDIKVLFTRLVLLILKTTKVQRATVLSKLCTFTKWDKKGEKTSGRLGLSRPAGSPQFSENVAVHGLLNVLEPGRLFVQIWPLAKKDRVGDGKRRRLGLSRRAESPQSFESRRCKRPAGRSGAWRSAHSLRRPRRSPLRCKSRCRAGRRADSARSRFCKWKRCASRCWRYTG